MTLTGAPGVGKSRLAVEAARSLEAEFLDGIWLVDFARAGGADDAVRLLAHAVDVRGSDPLARGSRLRHAAALLVPDACEHVLDEAARIASTVLAECPQARILATSREALHVASRGETPRGAARGRGRRAFLERARAARPGFEPDAEAVALAAEIAGASTDCRWRSVRRRARERARSRGARLHPRAARRSCVTARPWTRPAPLQGLVEWSYDLLHGDEKTLLQQLAVHRGGASLPSLVALAARHGLNEATVAYLVAALVDKSIVSASFTGGAPLRMLDTVREYARASRRERRARRRPRRARRILRGARRRGARRAARAGMAALGTPPGAGKRHPGLRGLRSRRARPCRRGSARHVGVVLRAGRPRLRGTALPRVALAATDDDAPVELRIEQLADLCYIATEEFDLGPALVAGERAVSLAATAAAPWQRGFAQLMLALALGQSGDVERAGGHGRRVRGG